MTPERAYEIVKYAWRRYGEAGGSRLPKKGLDFHELTKDHLKLASKFARDSKHPGKISFMKAIRKEFRDLPKKESTMMFQRDHLHQMRVLSGLRPTRPSLTEARSGLTEKEREVIRLSLGEAGLPKGVKLVRKGDKEYWYVKRGAVTLGVVSAHKGGTYDGDTDPDGKGHFQGGFKSPMAAAQWVIRNNKKGMNEGYYFNPGDFWYQKFRDGSEIWFAPLAMQKNGGVKGLLLDTGKRKPKKSSVWKNDIPGKGGLWKKGEPPSKIHSYFKAHPDFSTKTEGNSLKDRYKDAKKRARHHPDSDWDKHARKLKKKMKGEDEDEVQEAKRPTFKAARDAILDHLESIRPRWTVKRNLKVPHATDPHKEHRLYFKKQAVYLGGTVPGSGLGDARSLHIDIRNVTPEAFLKYVKRWMKKESVDEAKQKFQKGDIVRRSRKAMRSMGYSHLKSKQGKVTGYSGRFPLILWQDDTEPMAQAEAGLELDKKATDAYRKMHSK